jgi:hypothetical protein
MLIDLIDPNNQVTYNVSLAQIIGLPAAVYCSELIAISKKAKIKNKLVDDIYFKLDRKYIAKRTTLSIEQQINIDDKLVEVKVLYKNPNSSDIVYLDLNMLISIIANEDVKVKENLNDLFTKSATEIKSARRKKKIEEYKDLIECESPTLRKAFEDWIEAVGSAPKNKLTPQGISIFQEQVFEYTKGDPELAIRIIKIATVERYVQCSWAVNIYEKDLRLQRENNSFKASRLNNNGNLKASKDTLIEKNF